MVADGNSGRRSQPAFFLSSPGVAINMVIGSGVDLIAIARVARTRGRYGERFLKRTFASGEIERALRVRDQDAFFASRFAAKEAVMKALGTGWRRGVRFRDIEVLDGVDGRPPRVRLHGVSADLAAARGASRMHLALGRDRIWAHALAVMEKDGES